ncbi:hypothetical protein LEMLEM_LOCUS15859, partial [Lemmus lemmus]
YLSCVILWKAEWITFLVPSICPQRQARSPSCLHLLSRNPE